MQGNSGFVRVVGGVDWGYDEGMRTRLNYKVDMVVPRECK